MEPTWAALTFLHAKYHRRGCQCIPIGTARQPPLPPLPLTVNPMHAFSSGCFQKKMNFNRTCARAATRIPAAGPPPSVAAPHAAPPVSPVRAEKL